LGRGKEGGRKGEGRGKEGGSSRKGAFLLFAAAGKVRYDIS